MSYNDQEVISNFIDQKVERTPVTDRTVLWTNDTNSGSYSGQIQFNLQSLGSSNKWLNYSEAYLVVPYIVTATGNADYTGSINKSFINLKDGFHSIIDNVQISVTGKTICQTQNFINAHASFKLLNTMNINTLLKSSSSWGLFGDDPGVTKTAATRLLAPAGYYHNPATDTRNTQIIKESFGGIADDFNTPLKTIKDTAGSYYETSGAGAARVYTWVFMATIKLGSLVDFFQKVPLIKTTDIQMTFTYNAVTLALTTTAAAAGPPIVIAGYAACANSQNSGSSCPFTVGALAAGVDGVLTIESGIMKTSQATPANLGLSTCRFYVPSYVTSASTSLKMLQLNPTTSVKYDDAYMYLIRNIPAEQPRVETLNTGISNAKYLVCLPFNIDTASLKETWLSPFNTAPSTTSHVPLDNFQVMLGGRNIFAENIRYDFNAYIDQLSKMFSYAGDNDSHLSSGIISKYLYENLYRAYVCDLSRHEASEDMPSKSIVVSFTNTCNKPISVLCFVAYERSITLDTATGQII